MSIPSLQTLPINVLYEDLTLRDLEDEVRRKQANYKKKSASLNCSGEPQNEAEKQYRERGMSSAVRFLLRAMRDKEVAEAIFKLNFTGASICAPPELKRYLRLAMTASISRGFALQDRFTIVPILEPTDLDDQESQLSKTYDSYVSGTTRHASESVEQWTREEKEEHIGKYRTAPHRVMVYYLMKNVGLHLLSGQDALDDFSPEELARSKNDIWQDIQRLYQTVIDAPRCPFPILVTRVVRHTHQLPTAWFQRKMGRKMKEGEVIMMPTFLSTTLQSVDDVWESFGPSGSDAEYDPIPSRRDEYGNRCCIITIIVLTGVPMLPLMNFESNEHPHEKEVLLPPGIELVYSGNDIYEVEDGLKGGAHMETFYARMPTAAAVVDLQKPVMCAADADGKDAVKLA